MSHRITVPRSSREEIALRWIMQIQDPAFDNWPELSEWLAEDEENSALFDRLCMADRAVVAELGETRGSRRWTPQSDTFSARARRLRERAWISAAGVMLFATLLFVLVVLPLIWPA